MSEPTKEQREESIKRTEACTKGYDAVHALNDIGVSCIQQWIEHDKKPKEYCLNNVSDVDDLVSLIADQIEGNG